MILCSRNYIECLWLNLISWKTNILPVEQISFIIDYSLSYISPPLQHLAFTSYDKSLGNAGLHISPLTAPFFGHLFSAFLSRFCYWNRIQFFPLLSLYCCCCYVWGQHGGGPRNKILALFWDQWSSYITGIVYFICVVWQTQPGTTVQILLLCCGS